MLRARCTAGRSLVEPVRGFPLASLPMRTFPDRWGRGNHFGHTGPSLEPERRMPPVPDVVPCATVGPGRGGRKGIVAIEDLVRPGRATEELVGRLPGPLAPLARVAFNYRWAWTPGGPETFAMLDRHRWELSGSNPVRLLEEVSPTILSRAAADESYVERCASLERDLLRDLGRPPLPQWSDPSRPVAFLCAEYAIHPSLPLYAGGLGVLAGDMLKEASDRALPMVAVGLLYRQGYLYQQLDTSGWQHEHWIETDPDRLPLTLVEGPNGEPLMVRVAIDARPVVCQVWRADVGRVPLYLLDANRPENERVDRWITSRVYVGDRRIRRAEYAVLGIGGIRVLPALGIEPSVVHLNEGHAALAPLE